MVAGESVDGDAKQPVGQVTPRVARKPVEGTRELDEEEKDVLGADVLAHGARLLRGSDEAAEGGGELLPCGRHLGVRAYRRVGVGVQGLKRADALPSSLEEETAQRRPGVRLSAQRRRGDLGQPAQRGDADVVDEGVTVGEAPVERSHADAGAASDVGNGDVVAPVGEQVARGLEDPVTVAPRVGPQRIRNIFVHFWGFGPS